MLSSQALHQENTKADEAIANKNATVEELLKVLIKLQTLNLKLLHNIRTNQTAIMKFHGIELKEPKKDEQSQERK
jgi:hypothetical protein